MPMVADQPEDWTEPGAHLVTRGIYRVPLPLPLSGLGTVNCYVFEGPRGLVVVDPGWFGDETESAMRSALRPLGFHLDDIAVCAATHHHWDHYSQAYAWRNSLGCELLIGRGEQHSLRDYNTQTGRFPNHTALLTQCGASNVARELAYTPIPEHEVGVASGFPDRWLEHGETIRLRGDEGIAVIATPGHTRGHVVFHHESERLLFSGDHILPHITPSIGFEWSPEPHPLRSYIASLELVQHLPDAVVLPSHGPVIPSSHQRVDELLRHHQDRLDQICAEVASGAHTTYDVAKALRWTRRELLLDDLPVEHQLSAITEIHAHLDVLTWQGRVRYTDGRTVRSYVLTA